MAEKTNRKIDSNEENIAEEIWQRLRTLHNDPFTARLLRRSKNGKRFSLEYIFKK